MSICVIPGQGGTGHREQNARSITPCQVARGARNAASAKTGGSAR
jgi:hypothetical protein